MPFFMDIQQLKKYFEDNGGKSLSGKNEAWKTLFDLYKKNTGNKLIIGCGSCYTKAYRWLIKQ
jgi:hypothetical protein